MITCLPGNVPAGQQFVTSNVQIASKVQIASQYTTYLNPFPSFRPLTTNIKHSTTQEDANGYLSVNLSVNLPVCYISHPEVCLYDSRCPNPRSQNIIHVRSEIRRQYPIHVLKETIEQQHNNQNASHWEQASILILFGRVIELIFVSPRYTYSYSSIWPETLQRLCNLWLHCTWRIVRVQWGQHPLSMLLQETKTSTCQPREDYQEQRLLICS